MIIYFRGYKYFKIFYLWKYLDNDYKEIEEG